MESVRNASAISRFNQGNILLGSITESTQGITVYDKTTKGVYDFYADAQIDENHKKVLKGKDISSYSYSWSDVYINYGSWLCRKRKEKFFLLVCYTFMNFRFYIFFYLKNIKFF